MSEAPKKPTDAELATAFDIISRLYLHERHRSGMVAPSPFCYVRAAGGRLLVYSEHGVPTRQIIAALSAAFHGTIWAAEPREVTQ